MGVREKLRILGALCVLPFLASCSPYRIHTVQRSPAAAPTPAPAPTPLILSLASVSITNQNPTSSSSFGLTYGTVTGSYSEYCIQENSTTLASCSWVSGTLPASFTVSVSENSKTLSVWIRDESGTTSSRVDTSAVTLDTTPPTLDSATVTNQDPTSSSSFALTYGTVTGSYSQYCIQENSTTLSSCSWASGTLPASFTVSGTENSKTLSIWIRDSAGNTSGRVDTPSVTLDTTPPSLASLTVTNSSPTSTTVYDLLYGEITDVPVAYCIQENSTDISTCIWSEGELPPSFTVSNHAGAKVLSIWLMDLAGNISTRVDTNSVTYQIPISLTRISAGSAHSCGLLSSGEVRCWGLALGGTTSSGTPSAISGIIGGTSVESGGNHACVLMTGGTVQCLGNGTMGQLGNGSFSSSSTPVTVSGISNAISIGVGGDHSCAVLSDGHIKCWGAGTDNQLGNGMSSNSSTPVTVSGISDATSVALGEGHSCALRADGTIMCWGNGTSSGQLGNGDFINSGTPVSVSGITDAIQVASGGGSHTCALLDGGSVKCWGEGTSGQIGHDGDPGDEVFSSSPTPITVTGITQAKSLGLGLRHSCAVLEDNSVRCWGRNSSSQLGNGLSSNTSNPSLVSDLSGVREVTGGPNHSCAMLLDGSMRCWGLNIAGILGIGSVFQTSSPLPVKNLSSAISISAGQSHACAILSNGAGLCWGQGTAGALGNGGSTSSLTPVVVSGLTGASEVSSGVNFSCARKTDGTVHCWGFGIDGQLGNGSSVSSTTPVQVSGINSAQSVKAGSNHACALLSDNSIKCWGDGTYGKLGNGSVSDSSIPVSVSGITSAVALSVGQEHSCAILQDGSARCWGYGMQGQLGNGYFNQSTPVSVSTLSNATSIAAGGGWSCAVRSDGTGRCWGSGLEGQLGNAINSSSSPVTVTGLSDAVDIEAGSSSTCATLRNGNIKCWGYGLQGQLGNGSLQNSSSPVTVSNLSSSISISVSALNACALHRDGTARCWGDNSLLQLGVGEVYRAPTGKYQVVGFDADESSPLTSIAASSPTIADETSSSTITIILTQPSGLPWEGITPTYSATDSGGNNFAGACSVTNASGQSTCSLISGYAELKRLWLTSPIEALTPNDTGSVLFTPGTSAGYVLSGPSSLKTNQCSKRPFALSLTDGYMNSTPHLANSTAVISGLGFATLYSDPLCTTPISSSVPLSTGVSTSIFYIKSSTTENLTLSIGDGTYSTINPFALSIAP